MHRVSRVDTGYCASPCSCCVSVPMVAGCDVGYCASEVAAGAGLLAADASQRVKELELAKSGWMAVFLRPISLHITHAHIRCVPCIARCIFRCRLLQTSHNQASGGHASSLLSLPLL